MSEVLSSIDIYVPETVNYGQDRMSEESLSSEHMYDYEYIGKPDLIFWYSLVGYFKGIRSIIINYLYSAII
jgi:hypothetical protein